MSTKEMENLIPYFPDFSSPDIQDVIGNMSEFVENESRVYLEKVIGNEELYKHQFFSALLFMMTNRMLFYDAPGTGKSCLQIGAMLMMYSNTSYYTYTYICTGPSLKETMKYQALEKCTKRLSSKGKPNRIFKKKMEITSHNDFVKENILGKTYDEINENFFDKIVMIDEISKLILSDFSSSKVDDDGITYRLDSDLSRLNDLVKSRKSIEEIVNDESLIKSSKKYIQIWRLAMSCPTVRFIGLTGTPIVNHPIEFFILANLFLSIDKQYDIQYITNNIFNLELEDFERLNGIVSYLAPAASTAQPNYIGNIVNYTHNINNERIESKMRLYFSEMYYSQASAMISQGTKLSAKNTNYQIQCYTNIKGEYGKESYEDNDDDEETESTVEVTGLSDELERMKCASMFSEIMAREMELFLKSDGEGAGCCFIYNKLTQTVSGPFKKIAESYGFNVVDANKQLNMITLPDGTTTFSGLGNGDKPNIIFVDGSLKDKKKREQLLVFFSSKANVKGKKIQIIVGSKVLEMGANIGNTERMDRICSEWSGSVEEQSRFRVFRTGGHDDWSEYEKSKGRDGIPIVDLYYHAPYCRYFYTKNDYLKKFSNGVTERDHSMINPKYITYIVGLYTEQENKLSKYKIDGKRISGRELFYFCKNDENPYEFFKENLPESYNFNKNIDDNLLNEDTSILICYCGILYTETLEELMKNMKKYVYIFKDETFNFKELEVPAIGEERKLVDSNYCALAISDDEIFIQSLVNTTVCLAFSQYMVMERKNIISSKILRFVKQIAIDCKSNKIRNNLGKVYDYTSSCDYKECDFKCSSDIIGKKSKESFIYQRDELFEDNKNTIFSKLSIQECKREMEGHLKEKTRVSYDFLLKKLNFTKTIILESIIDILGDKTHFVDRFGFQLFISSNEEELFLRRDLNQKHTDRKWYEDIRNICGIFSEQNLEDINTDHDEKLMEKIFNIEIHDEKKIKLEIKNKIDEFLLNPLSSALLIEKAVINSKSGKFREICRNIFDLFKFYLYDLKNPKTQKVVYINTMSRIKIASSKQGMEKRFNATNFRILKEPYKEWTYSSKQDEAELSEMLKQQYEKRIRPELELFVYPDVEKDKDLGNNYTVLEDMGDYLIIKAPFYITVLPDGVKRLSRKTQDNAKSRKKSKDETSRDIKTVSSDEKISKVNFLKHYLYKDHYNDDYFNEELGRNENRWTILQKLFKKFDEKGPDGAEGINTFLDIMNQCNLVHITADEISVEKIGKSKKRSE